MSSLPTNIAAGQIGHITQHNTIDAELGGLNIVLPSGVTSGTADPANVQAALATGGAVLLMPGDYYGNVTVTGHEAQFVRGFGRLVTRWHLTATGIPAFQWTPAVSTAYSQTGTGGITGVGIFGVATSAAPADGSIALQMGDIDQLECDIYAHDCQYGLLLSNQYFWTEQGRFRLVSNGNAAPLVMQCAPSGAATRTGSFDRSRTTVYHNDWMSANFQHGAQLLAGAQIEGGSLRQYGNLSGPGRSGAYALYVSGSTPAGLSPATNSSIVGPELTHSLECDSVTTAPGTIFVDTGCYVDPAAGSLRYDNFAPGLVNGRFNFYGPISGDNYLIQNGVGLTAIAPTLAGATGFFYFKQLPGPNMVYTEAGVNIPSGTVISNGAVLVSGLTAPWVPPSGNRIVNFQLYNGSYVMDFPCSINSTGTLTYSGQSYTTPAASGLQGSSVYRA